MSTPKEETPDKIRERLLSQIKDGTNMKIIRATLSELESAILQRAAQDL